ncbi:T7SS effector LXG polymorphic toxin [Rossellomorea sp. FS2]|uniref:T7SS effector LXG polymorphic toxin n=1 Tax=Rossellomorea sp. FS2 TaxID=3391447 RepID=UPI003A4DF845
MKILDVDGFQKGIKEIEETLSFQKKQADQMAKAIQGVTDLDEAFKGNGGNAIRDFYRSKHLPLLEQYQTFLSDYQSAIKQMNDALLNLEPAPDGFMNEGFLENELQAGLHFAKQTTVHLTFEANETIKSVSDIVTLPKIEDETCMQYVVKAEREMSYSIEKVYEFDHVQIASLSSLQGQVDALEKQIMQLTPVFKRLDFNPVLLPTKKFKSEKEDIMSFALDLKKFKINPHNPADSAAILEGGLLALTDIVIDLVDTLYYMVSDPFGFAQGMFNAVIHLDETIKYLWNDVKQSFEEEFINGDQRSRVRFISYSGVYIAATIYGVKGTEKFGTVSKAGRVSNASKKGTKQDIPYNVMTAAAIKAAAHDGIKSFFDLAEESNRKLYSSGIGIMAKEVNSYSEKINDVIGKSKNVLNSEKFSTKMEKTYQKVVSGPVSKAVNSEAYSTLKKLVLNENGSVRFTGISGDSKIGTKGTGNANHPIRTYRNTDLKKLEEKYTADPRITVEMPYMGKGKPGTNAEGWLRDKDLYWKEIMKKHPESLSKANKQKIDLGYSPINDKTFRKHFPQYDIEELYNDKLIHHHVGGGGQAVAVPSKLHPGTGGIHNAEKAAGVWGNDSEYAELLEKFINK